MKCKSFDKGGAPCPEPATVTVFWPGQETVACDRHHEGMRRVAGVMGFTLSVRAVEPETPTMLRTSHDGRRLQRFAGGGRLQEPR